MKDDQLLKLYPEIEPYNTFFLKVSAIHSLHVEEVGNPDGIPMVFLHGGPGGGIDPIYRRFFDPKKYRVILFSQRGCGKSAPHAELKENTTWDLVGDIEKIRQYLNIAKWGVFGGSWGSTLALCYAIKHCEKVTGLILRGIFLVRDKEIAWFYQEGASRLFPDLWEKYLEPIPQSERKDLLRAYYQQLTSSNEAQRLKAAIAWSTWEAGTSKLEIDEMAIAEFSDPKLALAFARIECHYFMNKAWIPSDAWILQQAQERLQHIPTWIIQGRYDVVCPMETSWELQQALPQAKYTLVQTAGHSSLEKEICSELIKATREFQP